MLGCVNRHAEVGPVAELGHFANEDAVIGNGIPHRPTELPLGSHAEDAGIGLRLDRLEFTLATGAR